MNEKKVRFALNMFILLTVLVSTLGTSSTVFADAKCNEQANPNSAAYQACQNEDEGDENEDNGNSGNHTGWENQIEDPNNNWTVTDNEDGTVTVTNPAGNTENFADPALSDTTTVSDDNSNLQDNQQELADETNGVPDVTGATNVVVIQTLEAATDEATMSQGNQPTVADCSLFEGTESTPLPESEWITAEDMHDALTWAWKDGPTGGAQSYS
jgi:hypothetical protein